MQMQLEQVIRVKKTRGAAAPHTRITWASFLGSEEPSLKLLCSAKLHRSKSAIFLSCNINSLLQLRVGMHIIYIYIYIYLLDERYIPEVEMKSI